MKFSLTVLTAILLTGCDVGYVTDPDRIIKHINDCGAIGKVPKVAHSSVGANLVPFGCQEKVRSNQ